MQYTLSYIRLAFVRNYYNVDVCISCGLLTLERPVSHYEIWYRYSIGCYIVGKCRNYIIGRFCYIIGSYLIGKFGVTLCINVTLSDKNTDRPVGPQPVNCHK